MKEFEFNFDNISNWIDDILKELEKNKQESQKKDDSKNIKCDDNCKTNYPLVNIYDSGDNYIMDIIAPYTPKEEIIINIEKNDRGENIIIIDGSGRNAKKSGFSHFSQTNVFNKVNWFKSEMLPNSFKRTFKINKNVKINKIKARYENGILQVTMPKETKKSSDNPRKVDII